MFIVLLKPESLAVGAVWLYALSSLAPKLRRLNAQRSLVLLNAEATLFS